jgi:hypothetical protein
VFLRRPGLLVGTTLLSVLVQLAAVVLVWLIGVGLGLSVPLPYYGVLVPLVTLLTLLPVSLNGMGLRELGTVLLLAPLGVGTASAVTLSVLQFAAYSLASLAGGIFYLFGRPRECGVRLAECGGPEDRLPARRECQPSTGEQRRAA